jgi:hypothetical protein
MAFVIAPEGSISAWAFENRHRDELDSMRIYVLRIDPFRRISDGRTDRKIDIASPSSLATTTKRSPGSRSLKIFLALPSRKSFPLGTSMTRFLVLPHDFPFPACHSDGRSFVLEVGKRMESRTPQKRPADAAVTAVRAAFVCIFPRT